MKEATQIGKDIEQITTIYRSKGEDAAQKEYFNIIRTRNLVRWQQLALAEGVRKSIHREPNP